MGYTDSTITTVTLDLEGLWIHDPNDPQGTAHRFPYGSARRSSSVDPMGAGEHYAGRQFPVVDYGEHLDRSYKIGVDIPHGPSWFADLSALTNFAQIKRTVMLRDNRGRVRYGTISDFTHGDMDWGTDASFTFTEVDYARVTVS